MILIISCDQFYSSVVAKILHDHGVWFGECIDPDMFNEIGYYKNKSITQILAARYAGIPEYPLPKEQYGLMQQFCDVLLKEGYQDGQFGVVIRPKFQNCFDSQTPYKIAVQKDRISALEDQVDSIPYQIYGDVLMARNFHVMERIFGHCRIQFDKGIANAVIEQAEQCE